jgi:GNAT superfamily N-acetyltransferase
MMMHLVNSTSIRVDPLMLKDLERVTVLQPEGWGDILPSIQYYCASDFCYPLKATIDDALVGIGTAIVYGQTAWLAHIIVHKDFRNKGIGTLVTRSLVDLVNKTSCKTILLIATTLGEPVYLKLGFQVEAQYIFLDHGTLPGVDKIYNIVPFGSQYKGAIFKMDYNISGEDRKKILREHLGKIRLCVEGGELKGFYAPTLGEGLIVANDRDAGFELMKLKFSDNKNFCIPENNEDGIDYLRRHGFKEYRKASRMILGKKIVWDAKRLYSRIGGNLG